MRRRWMRSATWMTACLGAIMLTLMIGCVLLCGYAVFYIVQTEDEPVRVKDYAAALTQQDGAWTLASDAAQRLRERGCWAMLLDEGGAVVWSQDRPQDVPTQYSAAQTAQFARWYLDGWPVKVWTLGKHLFVLAQPKDSVWKYDFEIPMKQLAFWPGWVLAMLLFCFVALFAVSVRMPRRAQKRRDEARSEWIAGVSHDVRTPLSMVVGYAEALKSASGLSGEERRMAESIGEKGLELRELIADLNLTNRLEYAMQPLTREWLSPAALVREAAVAFLNEDAEGLHPVETAIAPGAEQARWFGDRQLLDRMLRNLIRNAAVHNPQGCRIVVGTEANGLRCRFWVRDTGHGFTQEQLKALKQPLDGPAPGGGHGLGLRIVRRVAEAHGGSVRFQNTPEGGGSCEVRGLHPVRREKAQQKSAPPDMQAALGED